MKFQVNEYVVVVGGHVVLLTGKGYGAMLGQKATQNESFEYFREDLIRHATAAEITKFETTRAATRKRNIARYAREREEQDKAAQMRKFEEDRKAATEAPVAESAPVSTEAK